MGGCFGAGCYVTIMTSCTTEADHRDSQRTRLANCRKVPNLRPQTYGGFVACWIVGVRFRESKVLSPECTKKRRRKSSKRYTNPTKTVSKQPRPLPPLPVLHLIPLCQHILQKHPTGPPPAHAFHPRPSRHRNRQTRHDTPPLRDELVPSIQVSAPAPHMSSARIGAIVVPGATNPEIGGAPDCPSAAEVWDQPSLQRRVWRLRP